MFLISRGELEGRFDPIYYCNELFGFLKTTQYAVKKISDVAVSLKSGFGAGKQDQDQEGNGIVQIRPTNVGNEGNLKFDKNVYLPLDLLETQQNNLLQKGDVLFNNTNSQELVGKTALFNEDANFLFSNHITRIRTKNDILPQFLVLLLNSLHSKKLFYSICTNWNNQSGVGIELLRSLKIPVPPLEKQAEIISIFETAYASKKLKETEAAQLLASIDGYLLKALGITLPPTSEKKTFFITNSSKISGGRFDPFYHKSEFVELEQALLNGKYEIEKLGTFLAQINYGASVKNEYADTGIPFLRISDLNRNEINVKEMKFLPESMRKDLGNAFVYENDFLISRSGTLGVVALVEKEIDGFAYGSFMIKFCLKQDAPVNKKFISYFLNSETMQKIVAKNKIGAIQGNITIPTIKNLQIPLPPLEKQTEIADHISALRLQAKQLQHEAQTELERAKIEVERMILG